MIEELLLAGKCFKKRKTVIPTVLTDRDLQNFKVPNVQTEIIPNASHDATLSQAEIVNSKVLDFLMKKYDMKSSLHTTMAKNHSHQALH